MNKRLKQALVTGLMVLGMGALSRPAHADTFDTMNVLVTPGNVSFGVTITSVTLGTGYNFGTVNLGATSCSTQAIVVTNSGTVSEHFVMKISTTSGGSSNWVPSGAYDAGTPPTDVFELLGLMYGTGSLPPNDVLFDGAANLITGIQGSAGASTYNQGVVKTIGAASKDLWLKLKMPASVSVNESAQKTMVLTVTGQGT